MRPLIVAIDGPSGAGKSTVSKLLARRLGLSFVDTGALYRVVALSARRQGIATTDDGALGALLGKIRISFKAAGDENRVFLDDEDVSGEIRTPEISLLASAVSARPVVRQGLLGLQRRLALESPVGAVLEGRDIGT
ncbi:MAG TPA: (d)CMP kinase, partial [Myxococcaceae bacterium]